MILSLSFLFVVALFFMFPNFIIPQDTTSPTISLNLENNMICNTTNQTLFINTTDIDGVDTIWYNWNGTNISYTGPVSIDFQKV